MDIAMPLVKEDIAEVLQATPQEHEKIAKALQLMPQGRSHQRIAVHIVDVPMPQIQSVPHERSKDRIIMETLLGRVRQRTVGWESKAWSLAEVERQHDERVRLSWFRKRFWPISMC